MFKKIEAVKIVNLIKKYIALMFKYDDISEYNRNLIDGIESAALKRIEMLISEIYKDVIDNDLIKVAFQNVIRLLNELSEKHPECIIDSVSNYIKAVIYVMMMYSLAINNAEYL